MSSRRGAAADGQPDLPPPLDGIKVLDLTHFHAGPYATMILGDMGADVIKVEPPEGDPIRALGTTFVGGESHFFLTFNRNKRSIVLDIKSERGLEVLLQLVANSDVFVHNFRPGVAERLGISYARVREVRPEIVYCAMSAFGQTGPYARKPAVDTIVQGMSGLMSITGERGGEPVQVGASIADTAGSLMAVRGILLALFARERFGVGQEVQVSMLDGTITLVAGREGPYFATGEIPVPEGNVNRQVAPFQTFHTADGSIVITVVHDRSWAAFCGAIGREDLTADERFHDNQARVRNRTELVELLDEILATRSTAEWLEIFEEHQVMAGPINNLEQVFNDPQVLENEMVMTMDHPTAGSLRTIGIPVKMSATPGSIRRHPPLLGEHTREVLTELGVEQETIGELVDQGVIA